MKRNLVIGSKINKWVIISEPILDNGKLKIKLKCECGKENIVDIRTINRITFSKSCRSCSQIERRNTQGREFNVGDIFMNLEILNIYHGKKISYKVKCLNCGNTYHTGHSILNKKKNNKGLYCCHKCFNTSLKRKKRFSMCTEHISLSFYKYIKRQADLRGIEFLISPEYLEKIYDGYCYLSGIPIEIGTYSKNRNKIDYGTASLDRLDSNKGYIEGNIKWCFKQINVMKHILSVKEFIDLCNIITDYNKNNQDITI